MKLGTAISKFATPIAKAFGSDCYDPVTQDLRPESPCAKARRRLDEATNMQEYASAIYDRFWSKETNTTMNDEPTDYLLAVAITAMDIKEAINKLADGKILSVNPRGKVQIGSAARPTLPGAGQVLNQTAGSAKK